MFRSKTLIVLAGMVAALFVSAAPASAWWEATGTQWKGPIRVIASGEFNDEGNVIKCPANEIKAEWSIQTKGQIKQHEQGEKQTQTKFGPHLNLKVTNWGANCTAEAGIIKAAAEVKPCELQLVQQKGVFVATGGVVTTCVIKALGCTIQIPAGMEKQPGSNEGRNVGLGEIKLENTTKQPLNQIDKANIKGIQTLSSGGLCPSNNETSTLTGLEFEVEGAKAV